MKRDAIALPLQPFTDDEEAALSERLTAMDPAALGHYVDSAKLALGNRALDASWRPRVEIGLRRAEAAQRYQAEHPVVVEAVAPAPAKKVKAAPVEAVDSDDE